MSWLGSKFFLIEREKKLQEINTKILHLANQYKQHTIERLLEQDPIEPALDFLMGEVPLPPLYSDSITPFSPGSTQDLSLFKQPDHHQIQQLYQVKSTESCVVPESLEILYQDYVHQRSLLDHYYDGCFHECLYHMEAIAKELGNYEPVLEKAVILDVIDAVLEVAVALRQVMLCEVPNQALGSLVEIFRENDLGLHDHLKDLEGVLMHEGAPA